LKRARQVCQEGLLLIQQYGLDRSPVAADTYARYGLILCEQHELDQAEKYILRGLELARERNYVWSQVWSYRALIRILLARNNPPAAEAAIQEAEQLAIQHEIPEYLTCGISGLKAKVWIRQGKIEQTEEYLLSRDVRVDGDIQYPHETEYWALASLCLARGDLQTGAILLERLLLRAEAKKQQLWVIRCRVLQALLYQAMGNRRQSLKSLRKALELAEHDEYIQTFLDEGVSMQHLLTEAFEQNIHQEYVHLLLQSFQEYAFEEGYSHGRLTLPGKSGLVKLLSERELEIIRLIAEGCTNKEIAQRLFISVRTVKYYTTSIYTKLDVSGRAHAAVRAKELGYLK
jgi:LuxR family maltose regulon positive regulatory protein